jgi:uncharacterized protein YyaL (SSP411 family)
MASAALHAARIFNDDGLRQCALRSLERIVLEHYKPGRGIAHCTERGVPVPGLLEDQIAAAAANLDAFDATGDVVYQMMAEELARQMILAFRDERSGGFFDRAWSAADVGLLKHPMKPFVSNCEAARMLRRVALTCDDQSLSDVADDTLRSIGAMASQQGPLAAHYLLAMRDALVR